MPSFARAAVAGLALWVALLFAAPVLVASTSSAAVMPAALTYTAGTIVCHQQAARSFVIAGRQMPVCARCTGLYVSALVGGLVGLASRQRRIGMRVRWVLAVLAVPTVVSWMTDFAGVTHTANATRALLAIPLGAFAAWIVVLLLREPPAAAATRLPL